jgi:hypothetical protein
VLPRRLSDAAGELSLFSTITVFGTAREVTLSEIAIEPSTRPTPRRRPH